MLVVAWNRKARQDLREILTFIGARNPDAADRMRQMFESATERLTSYPHLHRAGRVAGTREAVVHPNYIVIYRVESEIVRIVAITHSRQKYPRPES